MKQQNAKGNTVPHDRQTLTPLETIGITGFGIQATYKMLRKNQLPHIKVGTRFFVPRQALLRWLANCGEPPIAG